VDDPEDVDDDPRSYRDDDDKDDDDDEGDYSRTLRRVAMADRSLAIDRKPAIVMRLQKLETKAGVFRLPRITRADPAKKPIRKADLNMNKIAALRQKTSQI
jgi:hypothetical protein